MAVKLNSQFRQIATFREIRYAQNPDGSPLELFDDVHRARVFRVDEKTISKGQDGIIRDTRQTVFFFRPPGRGVILNEGQVLDVENKYTGDTERWKVSEIIMPNEPGRDDWKAVCQRVIEK